jgi:hypothetical protein
MLDKKSKIKSKNKRKDKIMKELMVTSTFFSSIAIIAHQTS